MYPSRHAAYLAWFARLGLIAIALGLLFSLNVAPASAKPTIYMATVTPHGTYASFTVKTFSPASMSLVITAKPNVVGQQAPPPAVAGASTGGSQVTTWTPDLYGLNPNTQYWFSVSVSDASGASYTSGTFITLKRQIQVVITTITVIDDSDALGAGELTFYFRYNGAWDQNLKYGEVSVSSGTTIYPSASKTLSNAPGTLWVGVQGWDDDCDAGDGLCVGGLGPGGPDYGSTAEADWATAYSSTFTIAKAASNINESYTQPFTMLTQGHALKFSAKGWFKVTYA